MHTRGMWKIATTYKRAQVGKYEIVAWENQTETIAKLSGPQAHANAALIVSAVNSHDALVDALKEAERAIQYCSNGQMREYEPALDSALSTIQSALAAALGEGK